MQQTTMELWFTEIHQDLGTMAYLILSTLTQIGLMQMQMNRSRRVNHFVHTNALWSGTNKKRDVSTGPLALLLAPLTCSLAPDSSLRSCTLLRSLVCSLAHFAHSLACGKVNFWCLKMTLFCPIVQRTDTPSYRDARTHLKIWFCWHLVCKLWVLQQKTILMMMIRCVFVQCACIGSILGKEEKNPRSCRNLIHDHASTHLNSTCM